MARKIAAMFRFSIRSNAAYQASNSLLAQCGVERDAAATRKLGLSTRSPAQRCVIFRVDGYSPRSVSEARSFVRGLFEREPENIWIDTLPEASVAD